MRRNICLILLSAALVLLPSGCEETVTEPEDEELITYGALTIGYESDEGSVESTEITPESGGSLSATGPDGVVYTLDVSAGAVAAATTVTVTPLRELSICSIDSAHVDTSCCIVGALFEPAGLEFDSTAVLTITYPASGHDCVLNDLFCVVSIDSASAYYEMIPTVVDEGVPSLTCTLTHFSGYGTHDPDYDFLEYQIEKYSQYGQDFPGDDILVKLMSLAAQAASMGWEDLRNLAWQGARPILDHLTTEAINAANADPCEATLGVLLHYLGPAQAMDFTDIADRILQAANDVVVAVATRGRELCQSGEREEGKALLVQAYDWACRGLVLETATRDMILDWLNDCTGLQVLLAASNGYVNTAAASASDVDAALLTLTATVLDDFGEAVPGKTVTIGWDGSGTWSGTTNQDGIYSVTVSGSHMGVGPSICPPHSYNRTFYAEAGAGGEIFRSDDLPIVFRDIQLTSTVSYTYNFSEHGENVSTVISAMISGSGTGCWGYCDGTLTRSYQKVLNDAYTYTAIDQLEVPACRFYAYYTYVQAPGTDLTVAVVDRVYHYICYAMTDIIFEECPGDEDCTTGESNMYLESIAFPFNCAPEFNGGVYVDNDGTGGLLYQWENSDSGSAGELVWSYSAVLSISVNVTF